MSIIFFFNLQGNWLYNSTQLMSKLKIAQLKEQRKTQQKVKDKQK